MAKRQSKSQDEVLKKNLDRFKASWDYAEGTYHDKWDRDWKLYNNQRTSRAYEGLTDTVVPMAFSTIETMVSALGNGRPRFDYEPADPTLKVEADTKSLNSLIDDYWEQDRWDVKLVEAYRQSLTSGTAPLFFYWDIDRPKMIHFPIRDAIIDPSATDPENLAFAGRRYLTTLEELESFQVIDTDSDSKTYGELIDRFHNLKDIQRVTKSAFAEDMDKAEKEMFLGSTMPKPLETQVEVIEIWDKERVVSIANRCVVIEDIENPYLVQAREAGDPDPEGLIPFIFIRNYTDVSLFYGKSEIEPIAPLLENLNDMTNMESDAILKQLAANRELDPKYADFIDAVDPLDFDTIYPFTPGSMQYIQPPIIRPDSFNRRMDLKNEIRETTAIDQVAKGAANVKDATATEVRAQLNQAGQRIEIKARMLEKDGFFYMGQLLFRMIQLYVTEPIVVSADGLASADTPVITERMEELGLQKETELPKGVAIFDPSKFAGNWVPHVSLEVTVENKKIEQQRASIEAYQILIQDPSNNLEKVKEHLYPLMFPDLTPEAIEAILTPAPEAPGEALPPEMGMTPPEGAMPPEGAPMPPEMPLPTEDEMAQAVIAEEAANAIA